MWNITDSALQATFQPDSIQPKHPAELVQFSVEKN